jgi:hypothetical protein
MLRPKGMVTGKGWSGVFFVTLLAIAAVILLIAQPVVAVEKPVEFDVKGLDGKVKKIKISYDSPVDNVVVTEDNVALKSQILMFPIELKHVKRIVGIFPGPFIVFDGSTCVCYPYGSGLKCYGQCP